MEQENCIQLSVQLLGYILIARGAGLKHKQMQRFSGFVDSLNNALPLLSWWDIFLHLWFALGHEEAKVLALTHPQQMTMLWSGSPSTQYCCGERIQSVWGTRHAFATKAVLQNCAYWATTSAAAEQLEKMKGIHGMSQQRPGLPLRFGQSMHTHTITSWVWPTLFCVMEPGYAWDRKFEGIYLPQSMPEPGQSAEMTRG